jgi:hypothetical protein
MDFKVKSYLVAACLFVFNHIVFGHLVAMKKVAAFMRCQAVISSELDYFKKVVECAPNLKFMNF